MAHDPYSGAEGSGPASVGVVTMRVPGGKLGRMAFDLGLHLPRAGGGVAAVWTATTCGSALLAAASQVRFASIPLSMGVFLAPLVGTGLLYRLTDLGRIPPQPPPSAGDREPRRPPDPDRGPAATRLDSVARDNGTRV